MGDLLGSADAPILVVDEELLEATTGYPCIGARSPRWLGDRCRRWPTWSTGATRILVLEDLVDHTNVGAVFAARRPWGWTPSS
jgi:hypothetical protein